MKPKENHLVIGRRNALQMLGLSSAVMLTRGFGEIFASETPAMNSRPKPMVTSGNSSVSFTTGTDRQQMIFEVIKPFEKEIQAGLKGKQLIIKVNMVSTNTPLCATHIDALRGLLEYLKPIYHGQIIIAESSAAYNSAEGFNNYGYLDLVKDFNIKFINLNTTNGFPFYILNRDLHLDKIELSDMFVDPNNYFISLCRLKTHDTVIMTGGVKNMVMAAPLIKEGINGSRPTSFKRSMHAGGPRWLHYNMYLVAQHVWPDFTIIDGVEGMEGNGPIMGTPVDHGIAMAGQDVLAIDSMCCRLMGISLESVGYLNYCAAAGLGNIEKEKISIIGDKNPDDHIIPYKLHTNVAYQLEWRDPLNLPSMNPPNQRPAQQPVQSPTN